MLCRVKLSEGTCSGLFTGAVAECLDFCKVLLTTRNGRCLGGTVPIVIVIFMWAVGKTYGEMFSDY